MNILQIIDLYQTGGAEKVYDLFGKYCILNGHTINQSVLYGNKKRYNKDTMEYIIQNEHTSLLQKLVGQCISIILMHHIMKKRSIDHIVSFLDRSNLVVIFACLLNKKRPRITVTIHNPPTVQYLKLNKYIRSFFFFVLTWAYNREWVKVIAVSQAVKDSLTSIGVKEIYVAHNPVEIKKDYPITTNNNSDTFILAIGRLDIQKAHWKLIKAFYFYKKIYKDNKIKLYIAGIGKLETDLKELCVKLGIDNLVVFLGYKNNIIEYINKSVCIVFSSFYEGFPISLIECMSLKKPFIGSESSIPIEIRDMLIKKNILNTYQTKNLDIDFNFNNINDDEKELAFLIHKIQTDIIFYNTISDVCYEWFCNNCSISNFDSYFI
jgi:glycosyltransferase involved in cell wall biosynthesis